MAKISATKKSQVVFEFDNGQGLSIIWGWGAYTQKSRDDIAFSRDYKAETHETKSIENTQVEIMPYGDEFAEWLNKEYGGDEVVGYVPVADLPKIISKCSSIVTKEGSHE